MYKTNIKFNRHYFPPWRTDKNLLLNISKRKFRKLNRVEFARLYLRYSKIKEAYLIIEFLELLLKERQISKKGLFCNTREIHRIETIYFAQNIKDKNRAKVKEYKPSQKELARINKGRQIILKKQWV